MSAKFVIVFADLSTYSGPPEMAQPDYPGVGIAVIVQESGDCGHVFLRNSQHYYYDTIDGCWHPDGRYDQFTMGLTNYLNRNGWKVVRAGQSMTSEKYQAAMLLAWQIAQVEFPRKSAIDPQLEDGDLAAEIGK